MACPTCDRTMHSAGDAWWCHFCGTLKEKYGPTIYVPNNVRYIIQALNDLQDNLALDHARDFVRGTQTDNSDPGDADTDAG